MKLTALHERFIEMANRPMQFGTLPVRSVRRDVPVIPVERWTSSSGELSKRYQFRRDADRDDFVIQLLAYESRNAHRARIVIDEGCVEVRLSTRGVGNVTSLDKEYAKYADIIFRELVYSHRHADEG